MSRAGWRALRHPLTALGILLVTSAAVFFALPLSGGGAARSRLGPTATAADVEALDAQLGLDRPIVERYWSWLTHAVRGDFGESFLTDMSVGGLVSQRMGPTLALVGTTVLVAVPLAIGLGLWMGLRSNRPDGRAATSIGLLATAVPEFALAQALVLIVAVRLHLLPAVSSIAPGESILEHPTRLVLPVLTLTLPAAGYLARLIASGVQSATMSDAAENARLNGVPEAVVVRRWIVPMAIRPAIPAFARSLSYILGGSLIVETVFALPGLAKLLVDSANSQDIPVVLAVTMLLAVVTVALNMLADVLVDVLTPGSNTAARGRSPRDEPVGTSAI